MALYDAEYTTITKYQNFSFYQLPGEPKSHCWQRLINSGYNYDPQSFKASSLKSPALSFIHALLSGMVTGTGESIGVLG